MADNYDFSGLEKVQPEDKYDFSDLEKPKSGSYDFSDLTKPEAPSALDQLKGSFEATGLGMGKGATMGFGDEAAGVVGALIDPLLYGNEENKSFADRYRENRDYARKVNDESQQNYPAAFGVGQVLGASSSLALPGGAGTQGLKALSGRAAMEGALYGAGTSEADITKGESGLAEDTIKGTIAGGITPSILAGSGAVAKSAGEQIGKYAPAVGKHVAGFVGSAAKALAGVRGEPEDLARKGAATMLGLKKKDLSSEAVQLLKENGLGFLGKNKKNIMENIDNAIINLGPPTRETMGKYTALNKLYASLGKADDSMLGEVLRTAGKLDWYDLGLATVGGPAGLAVKKGRDLLANRLQLKAPEIAKFSKGVGDVVEAGLDAAGNAVKKSSSNLDYLATKPNVTRNWVMQTNYDESKKQSAESQPQPNPTMSKVQGTRYQQIFEGKTPQQMAIQHKLLSDKDPEYRKLTLGDEEDVNPEEE